MVGEFFLVSTAIDFTSPNHLSSQSVKVVKDPEVASKMQIRER